MMSNPFRRSRSGLNCIQVGRVLQRYLDELVAGPLSVDPEANARIGAHLDDCRRCGMRADAYRSIKASLATNPASLPDEAISRLRRFGSQLVNQDPPPESD